MNLKTERYADQSRYWPAAGRHILAQSDEQSVVVYQAYSPRIGRFAATHGYFGGEFSYSRMSWIKPNFLWMMYRSGWGTKQNQETTLAVRLRRTFFDGLLAQAVPSSFDRDLYPDPGAWREAVADSQVRLQWDPDHDPDGTPLQRRALQLGLRGDMLEEFGRGAILETEDIREFVAGQRLLRIDGGYNELLSPVERVYAPTDPAIARRLKLTPSGRMSNRTEPTNGQFFHRPLIPKGTAR
ncbi:MAG TPA: DUF4291 domain-containing protein [Armatimonadota bacterium]|nr:DUF4291 domain-containing protein [Armatimonadota bacterium]